MSWTIRRSSPKCSPAIGLRRRCTAAISRPCTAWRSCADHGTYRVEMVVKRLTTFLFLIALVDCPTLAQTTNGRVSGTVRDTTGGLLPGVMVQLMRDGAAIPMSTNTNGAGRYQF